jgi:hypothetical protein
MKPSYASCCFGCFTLFKGIKACTSFWIMVPVPKDPNVIFWNITTVHIHLCRQVTVASRLKVLIEVNFSERMGISRLKQRQISLAHVPIVIHWPWSSTSEHAVKKASFIILSIVRCVEGYILLS